MGGSLIKTANERASLNLFLYVEVVFTTNFVSANHVP